MKKIIITLTILLLIFLIGCSKPELKTIPTSKDSNWRTIELTDVLTNNNFKINDFTNKPVLLESFAVWCPTCKKQQDIIKQLHKEIGDQAISISIDTDSNEDKTKVINHAKSNGFDWIFVVSPTEVTQQLVQEFGPGIVNAPSAPVVLICNNQAKLLKRGVKSVEELKSEIQQCS